MKLLSSAVIIFSGCLLIGMGTLSAGADSILAVGLGFLIIVAGFLVFFPAAYAEGALDDIRKMLSDAYRLMQSKPAATTDDTTHPSTEVPDPDETT